MGSRPATLGLWSGVGLVIANMIGTGVLTTAGFMAEWLNPTEILLAWLVGGLVAICGARAYAAIAAEIPRSGGEYRYLSELIHPAVGYFAGWTSLLVGFSAPVALAAATAGPFADTLFPGVNQTAVSIGLIVVITALHALDLKLSKWTQNLLVAVKIALLAGFIVLGVTRGSHAMPSWEPIKSTPGFPLEIFMIQLVYIAYSYSGWNAAIYAAEEFREPRRDVPRAMVLGAALVTLMYVAVNWVFVANQTPERLFDTSIGQKITLGHLITQDLLGSAGGRVMSAFVMLALFSSISAMTMVGPRVYAAMARDGFLPRVLAGADDRPPVLSIVLQGAIAITLILTHSFLTLLVNVGAILTLNAALTVSTVIRRRKGVIPMVAAVVFNLASAWMLYFAVKGAPRILLWIGAVAAVTAVAYVITRSATRRS